MILYDKCRTECKRSLLSKSADTMTYQFPAIFNVSLLYNVIASKNTTLQMSHVVRQPTICICENKDADQLCGNLDSTIPLLAEYMVIFSICTDWFVSDLVRIHIVGFLTLRLKWKKKTLILFTYEPRHEKHSFVFAKINAQIIWQPRI